MDTVDTPTYRYLESRDIVAIIELGEIRCEPHRLPVEVCALCNGHNYVTLRSGRVADRLEGGYLQESGSNPLGLIEQKDTMRGETDDPSTRTYFVTGGGHDLPSAGYRTTYEPPVDPDELRLPRWAESEIDFEELSSDRQAAEAAGMSWNAWHYARREPERYETATAVEGERTERLGTGPVTAEWRKPRQRAWSRWAIDWKE
jgi:hypothetical protein